MKTYLPTDENIRVIGRTVNTCPLPLFWTGAGVEFDFMGTELVFTILSDYESLVPWIRIEVDNETFIRTGLFRGENKILAFSGPDATVKHHVQLFRESQAMPDDAKCTVLLKEILAEGAILKSEEKKYKIEFIGDSLTSGEGLLGTPEMSEWMPMHMSTDGNYAFLTAKAVGAELRVISQCGWGIYHSWDQKTEQNIPRIYDKICAVNDGEALKSLGALETYDFSSWQADAVVINLGTNDASGFQSDFSNGKKEIFEDAVIRFLKKIRSVYEKAEILYAYGMCGRDSEAVLMEAVDLYKKETGDAHVTYVALPDMADLGAHSHPGKKSHQASSDAITKVLKQVLK